MHQIGQECLQHPHELHAARYPPLLLCLHATRRARALYLFLSHWRSVLRSLSIHELTTLLTLNICAPRIRPRLPKVSIPLVHQRAGAHTHAHTHSLSLSLSFRIRPRLPKVSIPLVHQRARTHTHAHTHSLSLSLSLFQNTSQATKSLHHLGPSAQCQTLAWMGSGIHAYLSIYIFIHVYMNILMYMYVCINI